MAEQEKIKVKVKNTFLDKGYMTVQTLDEKVENVLVKGKFTDIFPGDTLFLYGSYEKNKGFGRYFHTKFYRESCDDLWLAKWLQLKKGFSPKKIVNIIVEQKEMEDILDEYELLNKVRSIFAYLETIEIDPQTLAYLEQLYRWTWKKLIDDPYQLLNLVDISYEQVQHIIEHFHCQNPHSSKMGYFMYNELLKANQNGHFFLEKQVLKNRLEKQGVSFTETEMDQRFFKRKNHIYIKDYFDIEKRIAKNIKQRLSLPKEKEDSSLIDQWEKETSFTLAKNQKEAVLMALKERFCIVTGGPGVGKTTVCKCITDLLGMHASILMVAPTGRAAKRAHESTGLPTSTVHRLLEYNGVAFQKHAENQIETDILVIDECSMIDAPLLLQLLEATPLETKIIFVGDVDQLPSVGPGQTLKDMIESEIVPVTRLTEIFRQAADSPIITLAYAVNRGEMPACEDHEDLEYIDFEEEEHVCQKTVEIASRLYQENDLFDVQVLIPMNKGKVGIKKINQELQAKLTNPTPSVKVADYEIRLGDKVIQTKNDYEKSIYNGDVGIVTYVSKGLIKVRFQGSEEETRYTKEKFQELKLSYAITVHRSQGSEYKFAVIPTVSSYGQMLQKNLLYTAITRAKKKLWMIYQEAALEACVKLTSVPKRNTTLCELLKSS